MSKSDDRPKPVGNSRLRPCSLEKWESLKGALGPKRVRPAKGAKVDRKCWKKRHASKGSAQRHIKSLERAGGGTDERPLNAYPCERCGGWHVGHRPRKAMKAGKGLKAKPKRRSRDVSDYLKANPRCELTPTLDELDPPGWAEFKRAWDGHPEAEKVDPHHIHGRRFGDAVWNLVSASRVAHEFVQSTRVGRLVCVGVKVAKGEWDRETVRLATGKDQAGEIDNDLRNDIFAGRCELYAIGLLSSLDPAPPGPRFLGEETND